MINEELLVYIRQNLAAGVSKADLEQNLRHADWSEKDIASGFEMVENPQIPPPPHKRTGNDAMSKIKQEIEQAVKMQIDVVSRKMQSPHDSAEPSSSKGIAAWMVNKKLAPRQSEANIALIGVMILCVVVSSLVYYRATAPAPYTLHYGNAPIPGKQISNTQTNQ
jgi:hypothetical protein